MLKQSDIYNTEILCNACLFHKAENTAGSIAPAAQTGKSRHTGVVPTVNITFLNQLAEITLAHNGVGYVKAGKLILMRRLFKADIFHNPVVKRTVVFKFYRAHGVGYTLKCILNGMSKVIKRIDAPLIALTVMGGSENTVDGRVAHIHIRRGHIYLSPKGAGAVCKLSVLHLLKQL